MVVLVLAIFGSLGAWDMAAHCVTYSRVFHINKQLTVLHSGENYVFECEILLGPMHNIGNRLDVLCLRHCDQVARRRMAASETVILKNG